MNKFDSSGPCVLLSAHVDTSPSSPSMNNMQHNNNNDNDNIERGNGEGREEGRKRVYGEGVCEMKGGVAMLLSVFELFSQQVFIFFFFFFLILLFNYSFLFFIFFF